MNTVEDRLRNDATNQTISAADWADVVSRSDGRIRRQQRTMRTAVLSFLVLIGLAVAFGGNSGLETPSVPLDRAQPDSTITAQSPSPWPTYLSSIATWGISLMIAISVFYASPRPIRAPYFTQRAGRIVGTLSWVAFWNLLIAASTGVLITALDSDFLTTLHRTSGALVGLTVLAIAIVLLLSAESTSAWHFIFMLFAPGILWGVLQTLGSRGWPLLGHVVIALTIAALPLYAHRQLGFELVLSRFRGDQLGALRWKRTLPAVLIIIGLAMTVTSLVPARVLTNQLATPPKIDGWVVDSVSRSDPFATVSDVYVNYQPASSTDLLRPEAPSEVELTQLWATQTSTELSIVDLGNSGLNMRVALADPTAFERYERFRNLGISAALVGAMLLWSETAISRFTFGPNPWIRRSRRRENVGWIVFWSSALVVAAAGLVPVVFGSSTITPFVLLVLVAAALAYLGVTMVTPGPPSKDPSPDLSEETA